MSRVALAGLPPVSQEGNRRKGDLVLEKRGNDWRLYYHTNLVRFPTGLTRPHNIPAISYL